MPAGTTAPICSRVVDRLVGLDIEGRAADRQHRARTRRSDAAGLRHLRRDLRAMACARAARRRPRLARRHAARIDARRAGHEDGRCIRARPRCAVKVKKHQGRTASSRAWLERQLNDPYVAAAKAKGYRSRAAFKLIELDDKFHFLKKGAKVLDLGAAPGGWSQVARQRGRHGSVVAADVLEMEPIAGVTVFQADLTDAADARRC